MIKADLAKEVAREARLSQRDAEVVVGRIFDSIVALLKKGERIELRGFGTFGVRQVKAKVGRNLATGQLIPLAPYVKPYFKPGRELKPWPAEPATPAEASAPAELAVESAPETGKEPGE